MQPSGEGVTLEGATIIAPLSGDQLAANLHDYTKTDGEENDILESIDQTQALGQSLGGFNDLLLRRTLGLCLPPVDPISKQLDSRIWEAIGEIPQSVMPVDGAFLPVRAGALKLLNLCIVDSFGQTRELVNDSGTASAPQPRVIASAAMSPPAAGYDAGFSRKLVPPARLNFDWQPAAEKAPGPICGWIVPNFLDKSFAVFSARGMPLGVLESVLPTLAKKSIGSEMRFKWLPVPGSALAIEEIENLRLQRFVKLVTSFTADEGQAFLELADLVLRRTVGRVPAEDPAMAVLLGRPLALVHASLGLEVPEPPGYWKANGEWKFESEDFEKLRVPVLLGGMKLPSDGLVGYMADDDESAFFASEGATRRLGSKKKVKYRQGLSVACADELPVSLTLLMDTSAPVHASTGILPRHRVSLPAEAAQLASLIDEFYVGVAPVLSARPRESAAEPVMPQPSDAFGQWSWATRPDLRNTPPTWHDIRPADDRAYERRPGADRGLAAIAAETGRCVPRTKFLSRSRILNRTYFAAVAVVAAFVSSGAAQTPIRTVILSNSEETTFTVAAGDAPSELKFPLGPFPIPDDAVVEQCLLRVVPTPQGTTPRAAQDVNVVAQAEQVGQWSASSENVTPYVAELVREKAWSPGSGSTLVLNTESDNTDWTYHGGKAEQAAQRPRLIVTYKSPSKPAPVRYGQADLSSTSWKLPNGTQLQLRANPVSYGGAWYLIAVPRVASVCIGRPPRASRNGSSTALT